MAPAPTRAVRTDTWPRAWDLGVMKTTRTRKPLDLFLEALVHPVRFR